MVGEVYPGQLVVAGSALQVVEVVVEEFERKVPVVELGQVVEVG